MAPLLGQFLFRINPTWRWPSRRWKPNLMSLLAQENSPLAEAAPLLPIAPVRWARRLTSHRPAAVAARTYPSTAYESSYIVLTVATAAAGTDVTTTRRYRPLVRCMGGTTANCDHPYRERVSSRRRLRCMISRWGTVLTAPRSEGNKVVASWTDDVSTTVILRYERSVVQHYCPTQHAS